MAYSNFTIEKVNKVFKLITDEAIDFNVDIEKGLTGVCDF